MQFWSLKHQTLLLSPVTSTTGYCFCFGSIPSFFLELFLHWSPGAYWKWSESEVAQLCPTLWDPMDYSLPGSSVHGIFRTIAYWAPTNPGSSPFSILSFLPFHNVHGVLKARKLKWFAIPFSSGPHSVRPLHHDPPVLGGPTRLSFIELDKAVVHVIRLTSFLWLWFQCVFPLMPSHNTYHLTWVSLTISNC